MLVLSRKAGETIVINDTIVLTVVRVQGHITKIGIEAAPDVSITRGELFPPGKVEAISEETRKVPRRKPEKAIV